MTRPLPWKKVGSPKVLAEEYGKKLVIQKFRNPHTGKAEEYSLFGQKDWSVILPVTESSEVISVEQYKQGCDGIVLELPAGTKEPRDKTMAAAARRELVEETGFRATRVIHLGPPQFIATRSSWTRFYMFLGLGCEKVAEPVQDTSEVIKVRRIPLDAWIDRCLKVLVEPSAIVATFRALGRLGYSIQRR
jgi:8-oxo-dGTP pyrophosphatase MutT (NUDIX family)